MLLQQLALLDGFDLEDLDPCSADFVHLTVECAKLALADREAWYGDPDQVDVPLEALLSRSYADGRRRLVDGSRAETAGLHPGSPGGRVPQLPQASRTVAGPPAQGSGTGEPTVELSGESRGDTCHLDVADRFGNLVSATPSGGWLQSSPVVPGLGFPLSTRAQMFWTEPGLPNSVAPGKRPRTTLSPSLALRDGEPYLAFGTPGGDMQDQWQLLFLLRHLHHGMGLQQAIDAPAWHTTHAPSSFWPRESEPGRIHVEERLGERTIAELRRRDHDVVVQDAWSLGRLSAVGRDRDGTLRAGANPRGMQGYAVGR